MMSDCAADPGQPLLDWLGCVLDKRLSGVDVKVASAIACHCYLQDTRLSLETICTDTARKKTRVLKSIQNLEHCGYLRVQWGKQGEIATLSFLGVAP
jgi:predicted transcriptional regulator